MAIEFFKTVWEVATMAKKPKNQLSGRLQLLINQDALEISMKTISIDDTVNHAVYKEYVLEECEHKYNCDGYGNPLPEKKSE